MEAEFVAKVGEKLAELSAEKPLVGQIELAEALGLEVETLEEALDDLAAASVAVQVGTNAEKGRMWRHSGLDDDEARRLLVAQHELARREAEAADRREEEAAADELDADDGEVDDDRTARERPPAQRRHSGSGVTQRVELPMSVVGALSPEAVAEIVKAGVSTAQEAGAGFEFIVTL